MATKDTQSKLKNFTPDPDITPEALEKTAHLKNEWKSLKSVTRLFTNDRRSRRSTCCK